MRPSACLNKVILLLHWTLKVNSKLQNASVFLFLPSAKTVCSTTYNIRTISQRCVCAFKYTITAHLMPDLLELDWKVLSRYHINWAIASINFNWIRQRKIENCTISCWRWFISCVKVYQSSMTKVNFIITSVLCELSCWWQKRGLKNVHEILTFTFFLINNICNKKKYHLFFIKLQSNYECDSVFLILERRWSTNYIMDNCNKF